VDRVSIERMCAGKEFQIEGADTEKAPRGKVACNSGWSGKEICIGRTQGSRCTPLLNCRFQLFTVIPARYVNGC